MSIRRAPRPTSNFHILDKRISENESLSWAARGLLIYLLGKPDNWKISVQHLMAQTAKARITTGRDGIYNLINELKDTGFIRRHSVPGAAGKFAGFEYEVRECFDEAEAPFPPEADADEETLPPDPYPPQPFPPEADALVSTERLPRTESQQDARERAGEALSAEEASAAFDALFGSATPPAAEPPPSRRRPNMPSLGDPEHRWAGLADSTEIDPKSMKGESIHYRRGWAIRQIALMVANEVGWYAATIRPDWTPLLRWLDEGLDPHDSIIPAIRRVMGRQSGRTEVMSLSYFDRAVREEGTRRRRVG